MSHRVSNHSSHLQNTERGTNNLVMKLIHIKNFWGMSHPTHFCCNLSRKEEIVFFGTTGEQNIKQEMSLTNVLRQKQMKICPGSVSVPTVLLALKERPVSLTHPNFDVLCNLSLAPQFFFQRDTKIGTEGSGQEVVSTTTVL